VWRSRSLLSVVLAVWVSCAVGPPTLEIAPGWLVRLDAVNNSESEQVRFAEKDGGYLATNGPNAVFYRLEDSARGRYSLSLTVHHLDSHGVPHGAGLVFGGADLSGAAQTYSYFLVRDDGFFLIKTRRGGTTQKVTSWIKHDAVCAAGQVVVAKNTLRVEVGERETRFFVNGTRVHTARNTSLHVDGIYGLRMVHDLRLRFTDMVCTPAS
jgi:hypothetical protein